jgi:transmembrane sensor
MESSRQRIEDRATEWLRNRECESWSPEDEVALRKWLDESVAHRVAFLRAEAAWEALGRLKALGAGLPRRQVPAPETLDAIQLGSPGGMPRQAAVSRRRRYRAAIGIAASLVAVAGLALGSYRMWFTGDRYATPVGGVASLPLADGSRITLNTDSQVRVNFNDRQRQIDLSQGEAFFEVAHDVERPFVVKAGGRRVVAVGTKFSVRRERDALQVVVTEGRVRVEGSDTELGQVLDFAAAREREERILLSAGAVVSASKSDIVVQNHPLADAEEILSWRSGYVIFRGTRLADAAAEFNRYNTRQIVVRDPVVANMLLTGRFRSTNIEAFVALLEKTHGVEVDRTDAALVLSAPAATSSE